MCLDPEPPHAGPAIARTSSFGCSAVDGRIGIVDTRDVAAVAAGKAQALSLVAQSSAEAFS